MSLIIRIDYVAVHKEGFFVGKTSENPPPFCRWKIQRFAGKFGSKSTLYGHSSHAGSNSKDQMDSNGQPHQIHGQAHKGLIQNYFVIDIVKFQKVESWYGK